MKFTPRAIALFWRKLWSVSALDAMEPVLDTVIRGRDCNSGLSTHEGTEVTITSAPTLPRRMLRMLCQ